MVNDVLAVSKQLMRKKAGLSALCTRNNNDRFKPGSSFIMFRRFYFQFRTLLHQ